MFTPMEKTIYFWMLGVLCSVTLAQATRVTCDFEDGLCGWRDAPCHNGQGGALAWARGQSTPDRTSGPWEDHTYDGRLPYKGTFTYATAIHTSIANPTSTCLTSAPIAITNATEFSFWYLMNGRNSGRLSLTRSDNDVTVSTLWSVAGVQGRSWRQGGLTLDPGTNVTLQFSYESIYRFGADAAIDDVIITSQPPVDRHVPSTAQPSTHSTIKVPFYTSLEASIPSYCTTSHRGTPTYPSVPTQQKTTMTKSPTKQTAMASTATTRTTTRTIMGNPSLTILARPSRPSSAQGGLNINSSPSNITLRMTKHLAVTCAFSANHSSDIETLISLIISKTTPQNTQIFNELAAINMISNAPVYNRDNIGAQIQISGHISDDTSSFLKVEWAYPNDAAVGTYECQAYGMDRKGHPKLIKVDAEVNIEAFDLEKMIQAMKEMDSKLEGLLEWENILNNNLDTACDQWYV